MKYLHEAKVAANPLVQFKKWFADAVKAELPDVNAMTLSTVSSTGKPSARIVLLKDVSDIGFSFYTNYESRKGADLEENKNVALTFFWPELGRQIRIEGTVEKTGEADSDTYFSTRPRLSQLGAWASRQSKVLKGREELDERMRNLVLKYRNKPIPKPPHWGGYRVTPSLVEFWQRRPSRLHDRVVYEKNRRGEWKILRISP